MLPHLILRRPRRHTTANNCAPCRETSTSPHTFPTLPLGSTHGRATSGVACHHHLWAAHTVERHRPWHTIIAFGQHRRSNDVGVACHHRLCAANTVERRRAWRASIAFMQHTRSNDVGRGMPSSPLGSTHGRTESGVACHHRP